MDLAITDKEVRERLLAWIKKDVHGLMDFPTGGCIYDQHVKFIQHSNRHWEGTTAEEYKKFVEDYANSLEGEDEDFGKMLEAEHGRTPYE
jgi:hypothetical protein